MALARRALACFASAVFLSLALMGAAAEHQPLELDAALRQELYLPATGPVELTTLFTAQDLHASTADLRQNAPQILRFEAAHVGGQRLLFKATFARRPDFAGDGLILYADLDCNPATGRSDSRQHCGVDLMVSVSHSAISAQYFAPVTSKANTTVAAVRQVDNAVYIVLDAPLLIAKGQVRLRAYLASERPGGRSSGTPLDLFELPSAGERRVPSLGHHGTPDLRPLSDFRYHNELVKLEKLADKGMTYALVRPAQPMEFGRPRPLVPFAATARKPGQAGSIQRERVSVELLEERGIQRHGALVSFGLPIPQGGLFDLSQIRILAPTGEEVPAQLTATSFWKDDSLKWVLVEFEAPLAARAKATYTVELGNQVRPTLRKPSPLELDQSGDLLTVVTGPLKVVLNKQKFHLFDGVWLQPNGQLVVTSPPEGVRLVDEHGTLFSMAGRPPESVRIEEQGPRKIVVRVEGVYTSAQDQPYMRYIARLVFRAGSPRVDLIYTHVNDYLKTEFTDVTSLDLPLIRAAAAANTSIALADADGRLTAHNGGSLALFQTDEHSSTLRIDGRDIASGRAPGVLQTAAPNFTAVLHDFWQRWPKGLAADHDQVRIEFLPKQPGPEFGRELPHQLIFPFVEGFYRFKWGMSFTERVSFDFGGQMPPAELLAEANDPLVPVLPAAWYARTEALGPLAVPLGRQFALWDKHAAASYRDFLRARDSDRCFGYFNYGDWYGERGRNWGNNEYDFAHGYFLQFARTGNRDYFRVSLAAARHQADVDCVHAYPDPYYIGGNHEHSIGHTGMWTDQPRYGTWTWRYGGDTSADNGHTWSEGMVEAWFLTGDAPVMESALALGEHITWAMARNFKRLGTHERSAGWSLKAIIGLYRANYDPLYLDAARRIATVALAEQKFDDGGAWPHLLPTDHAGGRANAHGNAIFLIGILLQGLAEYHQEAHDPAVPRALLAGANWLLRAWNEEAQGWPYTALVSGEPLYPPGPSSNLMVAGPMAYAGQVNDQPRLIDTAEAALTAVVRSGSSGNGKAIAQQMNFTSDLLAILQRWYATHRSDKGAEVLSGGGDDMAHYLAKTADAKEHSVRGPNQKVFIVRLRGDVGAQVTTQLTAVRKPFGAMTKRAAIGTIKVLDSTGAVVKQGDFSTDLSHDFQCSLSGPAGTAFKVLIDDDQRGVWNLSGQRVQILMQTGPGFCIGGVGRGRYHFFVPVGTAEFRIHLRPGHNGLFAGVVLTPHDKIAGFFEGLHQPAAPQASKVKSAAPDPDADLIAGRGLISVRPEASDTGHVWSLVLTAGGDLEVELKGVPPYLALTAAAWPPDAPATPGK